MQIIAHADGACSGNPGPGGWAFSYALGRGEVQGSGRSPATTNNQMELTAFLSLLRSLIDQPETASRKVAEVVFRLDSEYVVNGSKTWLKDWKARGWRTASKKPVANVEIWREIDASLEALRAFGPTLTFVWVKGHSGDAGNERVDALAQAEAQEALREARAPGFSPIEHRPAGNPEPSLSDIFAAALSADKPADESADQSADQSANSGAQREHLLAAALHALNSLPRAPIMGRFGEEFADTYVLAAAIERRLRG